MDWKNVWDAAAERSFIYFLRNFTPRRVALWHYRWKARNAPALYWELGVLCAFRGKMDMLFREQICAFNERGHLLAKRFFPCGRFCFIARLDTSRIFDHPHPLLWRIDGTQADFAISRREAQAELDRLPHRREFVLMAENFLNHYNQERSMVDEEGA